MKYTSIKKIIYLLTTVFISLTLLSCSKNSDTLTWTSINVCQGIQGDAHLISKNGKNFLIDTGYPSAAKNSLLPFLKDHNISEIEAILITHPHIDHYGGAQFLFKNGIKINHLYMNMPTKEQMNKEYWGGKYKDLIQLQNIAKKYHTKISEISKGDKLIFDKNSYIDVLYAYNGIDTPVGTTDINDMSIITMIHDRKNRFLLTGDLNKKLGRYLAKNAHNLKADILKAPHHGAKSFAPNIFFDKVDAKYLIVPAPKNLWCSKRSIRTRKLAKDNNYSTYINGFHGHITVTSDGTHFQISTQYKPKNICK